MKSETDQLIAALRSRKSPLRVRIDDDEGWIKGADYDFDTDLAVGTRFHHPEGPIVVGFPAPIRRDLIGPLPKDWRGLTYEERKAVLRVILEESLAYESRENDYPWITFRTDGEIDPSTECMRSMARWLNSPVSDDELGMLISNDYWPPTGASAGEWTPGFAILKELERRRSVTDAERDEIGLRIQESGGPGGGSEVGVAVEGDVDLLKRVLKREKLPYRFARKRKCLPRSVGVRSGGRTEERGDVDPRTRQVIQVRMREALAADGGAKLERWKVSPYESLEEPWGVDRVLFDFMTADGTLVRLQTDTRSEIRARANEWHATRDDALRAFIARSEKLADRLMKANQLPLVVKEIRDALDWALQALGEESSLKNGR